jgi:uncharacterized membrane protein YGL010W
MHIDLLSGIFSFITYSLNYWLSLKLFNCYADKEVMFGLDHFWFIVALKVVSWILQFVGHGVFEKRKPALLSNIFTTMVAPDFVTIELLYYIIGHNKTEIQKANVSIEADIAEYRGEGFAAGHKASAKKDKKKNR